MTMSDTPATIDRKAQLRGAFAESAAQDRALLLPYMTAGLPDRDSSLELFTAMADAGADGFEIGIPYSDPLMDGPTIHEAGLAALAGGATMASSLELVEKVVAQTGLPVLVMTYVNPVLSFGVDRFMGRAAAAGASGLILADLPVDESDVFADAAERTGIGLVLFAAPTTTPERMERVVAHDPVFIYAVARLGVTGETGSHENQLAELSQRIRAATDLPIVAGVGIASASMAHDAAEMSDGVIVGSALVRRVLDSSDGAAAAQQLRTAVAELVAAVRR